MSELQQPGCADEWQTVQARIREIADRVEASKPDSPVNFRTVLDVAYQVTGNSAPVVLAGVTAVIPNPYDGETHREFADRMREAVER